MAASRRKLITVRLGDEDIDALRSLPGTDDSDRLRKAIHAAAGSNSLLVAALANVLEEHKEQVEQIVGTRNNDLRSMAETQESLIEAIEDNTRKLSGLPLLFVKKLQETLSTQQFHKQQPR